MNQLESVTVNRKALFEDDWENMDDDLCDEELAHEADILETRALTQQKSSSLTINGNYSHSFAEPKLPNTYNNGHSNYSSANVSNARPLLSSVASRSNYINSEVGHQPQKRSMLWSNANISEKRLCPESVLYASQMKLTRDPDINLEIDRLNARIKELEDFKISSEAKVLAAKAENDLMKEQQTADEQRIQTNLKTIQNLESQLAFKTQELTSIKWNQSQQATSSSKAIQHCTGRFAFPNTSTNHDVNNLPKNGGNSKERSNFPTRSSFLRGISANTQNTNNSACDAKNNKQSKCVDEHVRLNVKPKRMETLLMASLIRSPTDVFQSPLLSFMSQRAAVDDLMETQKCEELNSDVAHISLAIATLLNQNECREVHSMRSFDELDVFLQSNLKKDMGEVFLRFIDNCLSLPFQKQTTEQTSPTARAKIEFCLNNWHQSLRLLRYLVKCSPRLRHCILHETYTDSPLNWWKVGQAENSPNEIKLDASTDESCNVLKKLLNFFTPAVQTLIDDSYYVKLAADILEVLTSLATYSSPHHIARFLQFLNPSMAKICKLLCLKSALLTSIVEFLVSICSSPIIVKATCNEDNCIWTIIAQAWNEAASLFSTDHLTKLDKRMCQLLSQCLSHTLKPPFIDADDCHCPFDIGSSLVRCLYRYQTRYESKGELHNLNEIVRGVGIVHHLTLRDPCVDDHRIQFKAEYMSFLIWLNRIHKKQYSGFVCETFLEKFFPLRDDRQVLNESCDDK